MKKVVLVFALVVLAMGYTSCEPDNVSETESLYASDKDEEPDKGE